METVQKIALTITIIGALNWGFIGFFDFNLVASLFSGAEAVEKIIYALVGLCGLINLGLLFSHIKEEK